MKCNRAVFRDVPNVVVTSAYGGGPSTTRKMVECEGTIQGYYLEDLHMGYICDKCFAISNPDVGEPEEVPDGQPKH